MAGKGHGLLFGIALLGAAVSTSMATAETIPLPTPAPLPKEGVPARQSAQSGGGGLIRNLGPKLQCALQQVGCGVVTVVEEPTFVGSDGCLAIARDAPDADWEKLGR